MSDEQRPKDGPLGALGVLLNLGLARISPKASVARIASALDSPNEDTSMAAHMALVKLGPDHAGQLLERARQVEHPENLLRVLGDLGEPEIAAELGAFATSQDPRVAAAAREAIAALAETEAD